MFMRQTTLALIAFSSLSKITSQLAFRILILVVLVSIASDDAYSQENFEVDGLFYRRDDNHGGVKVVNPNSNYGDFNGNATYKGDIYIPSSIYVNEYGNETSYTVTGIDHYAFYGSSITSIYIPSSVQSIGYSAFSGCSDLKTVSVDNNLNFKEEVSTWGNAYTVGIGLENTSWYNSQPDGLIYLGKVAFSLKNPSKFQSVTIKSGTERISSHCFTSYRGDICFNNYSNSKLQTVSIPTSVVSIGFGAFQGCSNLREVNIPSSVKEIGHRAFQDCEGLTSLTLPTNLWWLGYLAFSGCTGLKDSDIVIPDKVEIFFLSTFYGCGLSSLTIGKGVKCILRRNMNYNYVNVYNGIQPYDNSINDYYADNIQYEDEDNTTYYDYMLTDINTVKNYYERNDYTMYGYSIMGEYGIDGNKIRWGADVKTVECAEGNTKFDSRNNSNAIINTSTNKLIEGGSSTIIPNGVTTIGFCAFKDCSITNVNIPSSVTNIELEAFRGCKLTSIIIPSNVQSIGICSFANCVEMESATLEEGVTAISDCAFAYANSLSTVSIPSTLESIGNYAFNGCTSLTSVTVDIAVPLSINTNTFSNRTNATLYVPAGCKAAYEAADYWKEFKEIVELPASSDNAITVADQTACRGGQVQLPVSMNNLEQIVGFQFDLLLPEGITVATDAHGNYVTSLTDRKDDHTLSVSKVGDNQYRFVSVSMNNKPFAGNDGALVNVKLKVDESVTAGSHTIKVTDAELTTIGKEAINAANAVAMLTVKDAELGDVNGDMTISVTDVVAIISHILNDTPASFIESAADVNNDGRITVTDAVGVIDMILNKQ